MKVKVSIIYSWFIRTVTYFLPNLPIIMRFRGFLYSLMMKECGKNFQVASSAIINSLAGLIVGSDVYIGSNTIIIAVDLIIENEVLIGPSCVISGGNHTFSNGSFRFGPSIGSKVKICKGSWVAANCTITAGSALPPRSILAANAVLSSKFDKSDCLYAGIPAKFIKEINENNLSSSVF
jgi:acetyltransferase-like isoleucine patch superfamily enzyme